MPTFTRRRLDRCAIAGAIGAARAARAADLSELHLLTHRHVFAPSNAREPLEQAPRAHDDRSATRHDACGSRGPEKTRDEQRRHPTRRVGRRGRFGKLARRIAGGQASRSRYGVTFPATGSEPPAAGPIRSFQADTPLWCNSYDGVCDRATWTAPTEPKELSPTVRASEQACMSPHRRRLQRSSESINLDHCVLTKKSRGQCGRFRRRRGRREQRGCCRNTSWRKVHTDLKPEVVGVAVVSRKPW